MLYISNFWLWVGTYALFKTLIVSIAFQIRIRTTLFKLTIVFEYSNPSYPTLHLRQLTFNCLFSKNMTASKALSMSAPGAINLDHTTVKFDSEIKKARHSITTHTGLKVTVLPKKKNRPYFFLKYPMYNFAHLLSK